MLLSNEEPFLIGLVKDCHFQAAESFKSNQIFKNRFLKIIIENIVLVSTSSLYWIEQENVLKRWV